MARVSSKAYPSGLVKLPRNFSHSVDLVNPQPSRQKTLSTRNLPNKLRRLALTGFSRRGRGTREQDFSRKTRCPALIRFDLGSHDTSLEIPMKVGWRISDGVSLTERSKDSPLRRTTLPSRIEQAKPSNLRKLSIFDCDRCRSLDRASLRSSGLQTEFQTKKQLVRQNHPTCERCSNVWCKNASFGNVSK